MERWAKWTWGRPWKSWSKLDPIWQTRLAQTNLPTLINTPSFGRAYGWTYVKPKPISDPKANMESQHIESHAHEKCICETHLLENLSEPLSFIMYFFLIPSRWRIKLDWCWSWIEGWELCYAGTVVFTEVATEHKYWRWPVHLMRWWLRVCPRRWFSPMGPKRWSSMHVVSGGSRN